MATYKQLKEQAEKMLAEAEGQRQKELSDVINGVITTLKTHEISLDDLRAHGFTAKRGRKSKGKRSIKGAGVAKYQDPKSGATWTGHGRVPAWLLEYEEAGKKRDKFLIK
jgi:DNA-binding protein H-NS